jgi:hypothetical protein
MSTNAALIGKIGRGDRGPSWIERMRVGELSPEERARIPEFIDKWTGIGLSVTPVDHEHAERLLRRLYTSAGLLAPGVVWAPCPMTAMLSAILYTRICAGGREQQALKEGGRADMTERMTQEALTRTAGSSAHRAMQQAIERAVAMGLAAVTRPWTGFDAAVAIRDLRRALDTRFTRAIDEGTRQRVHRALRLPVEAGLRPLSAMLKPALNTAFAGLSPLKVQQAARALGGGPFWIPHLAMLDYAERVLGVPLQRVLLGAVECGGLFWMLDGIVFAAERPSHINRDTRGLLHCEIGPSLAYPSGWASWHWHGVPAPQPIIEEPQHITLQSIREAHHPTLRQVMIERYRAGEATHGLAAYLRDCDARPRDQDPACAILRHIGGDRAPRPIVVVPNRSPQPHGSHRQLRPVRPEVRPARAKGGNNLRGNSVDREPVRFQPGERLERVFHDNPDLKPEPFLAYLEQQNRDDFAMRMEIKAYRAKHGL